MFQAKISYIRWLFLDYSMNPFNQDGQAATLGYKDLVEKPSKCLVNSLPLAMSLF